MERLRANGVGDSKDIVHETVWTIFSHVERSGTTGIATLVESDCPVSGCPKAYKLSCHQLENSGQPAAARRPRRPRDRARRK